MGRRVHGVAGLLAITLVLGSCAGATGGSGTAGGAADEICLGGQGDFRYFVVGDGIAFDLGIELSSINVFMDEVCSGEDTQSGAHADCVFAEHERIDAGARPLVAELLGG